MWGAFADGREAQRLADLGPCGLAQAYAGWRVDFGDAPCGATGVEGADCEAFTQRSGAFEYAARLAAGSAPPAQATVVGQLRALAGQDADRSSATPASTDAFVGAFVATCPMEYLELMSRFVD